MGNAKTDPSQSFSAIMDFLKERSDAEDKSKKIQPRDFTVIRDLIMERTGIFIRDSRSDYLEYRVKERMLANSITEFEEYYYQLKYSTATTGEFQELINLITVQETSFFRNPEQIDSFKKTILKEILAAKGTSKRLRFWSAASSTGEEALTIAMVLNEALPNPKEWDIEILATDISTRALGKAREALYPDYRFNDFSSLLADKYFTKGKDGYRAKRVLTDLIDYKRLNLSSDLGNFISERASKFDSIFCRNVFIYFPEDVKEDIAASFRRLLEPWGYVLLGNAESIDVRKVPFKMTFLPGGMVYKKV